MVGPARLHALERELLRDVVHQLDAKARPLRHGDVAVFDLDGIALDHRVEVAERARPLLHLEVRHNAVDMERGDRGDRAQRVVRDDVDVVRLPCLL